MNEKVVMRFNPHDMDGACGSVVGEPTQPSFGEAVGRMLEKLVAPMRAVDRGMPLPEGVFPLADDPAVADRIAHVRLPNEKLMQFFARTGLGPTQILNMTRQEITRFVAQSAANAAHEVHVDTIFERDAKRPAPRAVIDTW